MKFGKFGSSIILAVLYAALARGTPMPFAAKHATHHVREISSDLKLESYHPPTSYQTFGSGIDHPLRKRQDATVESSSVAFVESQLGVKTEEVNVKSTAETEEASHAYLQQKLNGIPFANAVANVAFNKNNQVVAFGSSFVRPSKAASSIPSIKVEEAIATAERTLNGKFLVEEFPAPTLEYLAKEDGTASLTHVFQVRNEDGTTWYEAFVDAHTGELVSITDFTANAAYRVIPITSHSPVDGFKTVTDPQDTTASPRGWHSNGNSITTETAGNNAISYIGKHKNTTAQSGPGLQFIYKHDPSKEPFHGKNADAARVNAFYVVNTVHDISYKYGFTEKTFNFQNNNFGKGGKGGDRVNVSVQDNNGTNNAMFATPPDGQNGAMVMFLWDLSIPGRDGALGNDVIAHENTHGITNRMTGGGTGRCLQTTEARGLGEGWSDAFAEWTEQKSATIKDWTIASYLLDNMSGVRFFPYSTDTKTNPLRYFELSRQTEVHIIGEVWANMLHNVYAALVKKYGFSKTAHTDPTGGEGNIVFLHIFMDSLSLQPCNPTFVNARDAWIQADVNRYGGANRCLLWTIFASRGLGVKADSSYADDTTVPSDCAA
ncbi:Fungalysin metallopeptidase-domain-containing protein [Cristinia sonorae]|uniref:Extracellular metalloproteinase n=1 Tax=Cristinia sonorae TaxID=1940300 RepID=A0A8K0XQV5_9AGAR|nr:Fungalysin metallopeptidase-domain-containing protein [Cristinia sonorae]